MTSEQVIKDLRACLDFDAFGDRDCIECSQEDWRVCRNNLMKQALDLVNRQKVEIEALQYDMELLKQEKKFIENQAIKEFARIVKENMTDGYGDEGKIIYESNFDYLVKDATDEVNS